MANAKRLSLEFTAPHEVASDIASRVRTLRLMREWTQAELAARAGITLASYRRFEATGLVSLERLLKIAYALGVQRQFESLFQPPPAATLDELEELAAPQPTRQRGRSRRRDAKA